MDDAPITSLQDLTKRIGQDSSDPEVWPYRWFRGERCCNTELTPRLYRKTGKDGRQHYENLLLQNFRLKAPTFATELPDREETDKWLFLAQHVGLPTRLLDWTESLLVALFFALRQERQAVIWMLNPIALNRLSTNDTHVPARKEFPLTWVPGIGNVNIRGAWEDNGPGVDRPVAVLPAYVHPRMRVQRSCFTVHGKDKRSLAEQVESHILKRYKLSSDEEHRKAMRDELRLLGIDHSTIYPDLDGLARELTELF